MHMNKMSVTSFSSINCLHLHPTSPARVSSLAEYHHRALTYKAGIQLAHHYDHVKLNTGESLQLIIECDNPVCILSSIHPLPFLIVPDAPITTRYSPLLAYFYALLHVKGDF